MRVLRARADLALTYRPTAHASYECDECTNTQWLVRETRDLAPTMPELQPEALLTCTAAEHRVREICQRAHAKVQIRFAAAQKKQMEHLGFFVAPWRVGTIEVQQCACGALPELIAALAAIPGFHVTGLRYTKDHWSLEGALLGRSDHAA